MKNQNGTRIKKAKVLAAIPESGGILTIIAGRLGVSWSTAQRAIEAYPETKQAYQDEQERMLDLAEGKLYDSITRGETQDIKWFLSKKGKKRGYGEQLDITSGDKPLQPETMKPSEIAERVAALLKLKETNGTDGN